MFQSENGLIFTLVIALVHDFESLFEEALKYLGKESVLRYQLTEFDDTRLRTDIRIRGLLELLLHGAIAVKDDRLANKVLSYGRANTFVLRVTD